jgi:hypothetical protein
VFCSQQLTCSLAQSSLRVVDRRMHSVFLSTELFICNVPCFFTLALCLESDGKSSICSLCVGFTPLRTKTEFS